MTTSPIVILSCLLQVTLIATTALVVGIFTARATRRRSAMIPLAGLSLVVLVTAITPLPPLPWPEWLAWRLSLTANAANNSNAEPSTVGNNEGPARTAGAPRFDVLRTLSLARSAVHEWLPMPNQRPYDGTLLLFAWLACLLYFLARTARGWSSVWRLAANCQPIADPRVETICRSIGLRMGVDRAVSLRETSHIRDAATFGTRNPIILLPREWRVWSSDELHVVLAHELAHVQRRDFPVRLAAHLLASVHGYHPIVRRLIQQLTLHQELAADELAAHHSGGPRQYARVLSQLALRIDARTNSLENVVPPAIAPVFSGFLIRRISMLRAMDGSPCTPRMASIPAAALATLVAITVLSFGLSGSAQPPSIPESNQQVAPARTVEPVEPAVRVAKKDDPIAPKSGLFQRAAAAPPRIAEGSNGALVFRCADLMKRQELALFRELLNQQLRSEFSRLLPSGQDLDLRVEDIEQFSCDCKVEVKILNQTGERQPEGKNGSLTVGASAYVIQLSSRHDWRALLDRHPDVNKCTIADRTGYEFPMIPALSPFKPMAYFANDTTLVISHGDGHLKQWINDDVKRSEDATRDTAWKSVQGGVLTVTHDNTPEIWKMFPPSIVDNDGERALIEVARRVTRTSLGVDWAADGADFGIRLRLDTASREDAEEVRQAIDKWGAFLKSDAQSIETHPIIAKLLQLTPTARIEGSTVVFSGVTLLSATELAVLR